MKKTEDYYPIYLDYFKGREDYLACQGPEYYYPVNKTLDKDYLHKHLNDLATFGVYVLTSESKCHFLCIDIDIAKNELTDFDVNNPSRKFEYLKEKLVSIKNVLKEKLELLEEQILLEDTGGRGYHIWLFFKSPLNGADAIKLNQVIKKFITFDFEFFPKQPSLSEKRRFGNLIKLPLGTHQKYEMKSMFFELENGTQKYFESLESNLDVLERTKKIDHDHILSIIKKFNEVIDKTTSLILILELSI